MGEDHWGSPSPCVTNILVIVLILKRILCQSCCSCFVRQRSVTIRDRPLRWINKPESSVYAAISVSALFGSCLHTDNGQHSIVQLALDIDTLARKTDQRLLVSNGQHLLVGGHKHHLCAHRQAHLAARSVDLSSTLVVANPTIKVRRLLDCRGCSLGGLFGLFFVSALSCSHGK